MGDSFTNEAFTLLSLAIVVIILRIVARIMTVGLHNFQLDDYLMPLAGVRSSTLYYLYGHLLIRLHAGGLRARNGCGLLRRGLVERTGQQPHDG